MIDVLRDVLGLLLFSALTWLGYALMANAVLELLLMLSEAVTGSRTAIGNLATADVKRSATGALQYPRRRRMRATRFTWMAGALIALVLTVAACGTEEVKTEPNATAPETQAQAPTEEPTTEEEAEVPAPEYTVAQENAIASAESYLDFSAFSKKGLIEQLRYEGFKKADAIFAVEHIDVSWKAQAAQSAKDYLETSSFSRSGLIEQLEYEGFTHAQAVYGVSKTGL